MLAAAERVFAMWLDCKTQTKPAGHESGRRGAQSRAQIASHARPGPHRGVPVNLPQTLRNPHLPGVSTGGRYWDRTSDLCRVNAKPIPPVINGYHQLSRIGGTVATGRHWSSMVIAGRHVVAVWSRPSTQATRCRRAAIGLSSTDVNLALAIAGLELIRAIDNERRLVGRDTPEWSARRSAALETFRAAMIPATDL